MDDYERIHLVKPEVYVYRIPPVQSNRGYKAADWKLDSPDWTGRLRLVSKHKQLELKLEDKTTGELFAKAPIDKYPGLAVESVQDSSRYFVIRLQDESGRTAFIGIGFQDRSDSFDLNVALQDFFKDLHRDEQIASQPPAQAQSALNLGFKEGQTITLNIGTKKEKGAVDRPRASAGGSSGSVPFLPPPPSGLVRKGLPPQAGSSPIPQPSQATSASAGDDLNFLLG